MNDKKALCPICDRIFTVDRKISGKIGGALAGASLSSQAPASPLEKLLLMVLGTAAGAVLGDWVDRNILPECPYCGGSLQPVDKRELSYFRV